MGARYDNIGGVQHKVSKRYDNIAGVWRPANKRYDNIAGVWRQSFSGAVEWTYQASVSGKTFYVYTYGANEGESAYIGIDADGSTGSAYATCDVLYTLKESFSLPAGSTISINITASLMENVCNYSLYINGIRVWTTGIAGISNIAGIQTYTVPSAVTVSTITASVYGQAASGAWNLWNAAVTINPLGGDSFLLNSTGKSN